LSTTWQTLLSIQSRTLRFGMRQRICDLNHRLIWGMTQTHEYLFSFRNKYEKRRKKVREYKAQPGLLWGTLIFRFKCHRLLARFKSSVLLHGQTKIM
jgi:hypothetical protein